MAGSKMVAGDAAGSAPGRVRTPSGYALAVLLVLGAFAVVLATSRSRVFDIERFTVPKELALALTGLACLAVLLRGWRRIEAGAVDVLLSAYVLWSGLSVVFATNRWLALEAFGVSLAGLFVYMAARRVAAEGPARATLAGLVAAVVVGAALGAAQAYGAHWVAPGDSRPPGGTFGNRNFLAHLTVIALPALLLLTLRSRRRWRAILGLLALAVSVAAVVLTRSRGAWLGLGAALMAMTLAVVLARARPLSGIRHDRLVLAGAVLAMAVAAAITLPNALNWRSTSPYAESLSTIANYREGSGHGRLIQYRNSMKLVLQRPLLGVGPGNWFVQYPRVTTPGDPSFSGYDPIPTNPWPSSDWVAILAERGLVGAALLALAFGVSAAAALRRVGDDDPARAARAVALLGILTAVIVTGLFDAVLLLAAPTLFVFAALGLLLPAARPVLVREPTARSRRVAATAVVALLAAVTVLTGLRTAAVHVTRDRRLSTLEYAARIDPLSYRLQLMLGARGPCDERVPHARAAARLLPYHSAPRALLRACGAAPPR